MPAPYTNIDAVKEIVEVPAALSDATIERFMSDADLIVGEQLEGRGMSVARLESIARYLTAHFITVLVERGGLTSQEVDNARETYGSPKEGAGLAMTRYGQQAIALDSSGTLKAMANPSKKLNAQFRVM